MKKYMKRDGTVESFLPDLDQYVEVAAEDAGADVVAECVVILYRRNPDFPHSLTKAEVLGEEVFSEEPTEAQVRWCIFKHKAEFAEVRCTAYLQF